MSDELPGLSQRFCVVRRMFRCFGPSTVPDAMLSGCQHHFESEVSVPAVTNGVRHKNNRGMWSNSHGHAPPPYKRAGGPYRITR